MEKKETHYGNAFFVALIGLLGLLLVGLVGWGLIWLLLFETLVGILVVSALAAVVGLTLLVQYLDDKYGWFDLANW